MIEEKGDRFIYLDANVFIYFVEGPAELAEPLCSLFEFAESGGPSGNPLRNFFVTSELALAEVLSSSRTSEADRDMYCELILGSAFIAKAQVNKDILLEAARLRREFGFKLPDAIHAATALYNQCDMLVSRDKHMNRLEKLGIVHIEPTPSNLTQVIEALRAG
jgi:predicted nucleic acid-binding protein